MPVSPVQIRPWPFHPPARRFGGDPRTPTIEVDASGDLTAQLLLRAYCNGLFPMAEHRRGAIRWFSPSQRGVLPLASFHVPRRLRRRVRQAPFTVTMDRAFAEVIRACAEPRGTEGETWINDEIIDACAALHRAGLAHSVEAWSGCDGGTTARPVLVGGIYGVALGGAFFGESMFSRSTDASKICLVHLVEHLRRSGFVLFDVQYVNPHLEQFGVTSVPRETYMRDLAPALAMEARW